MPAAPVGNVTVSVLTNNFAAVNLSGLTSQTQYVVCLVAQDVWLNRDTEVEAVPFTTLDITPPELQVVLQPGSDGSVTCDRCER